ncbi:hypothetical protein [Candidatus Enterococcus mansonii]|uniref:Uncharacterized protein n=1 Tax=Candidatus Enterococcus mansonii TaxID=1834181 RepID=A0A242CGQ6_9ENTE|nr:hypothetical protein [Enterococcus sp. 4G2_DIV0659]OTO09417.1 hypothetical protein A5880_000096 [Enterococcus sp. 4G2_DIV0659]
MKKTISIMTEEFENEQTGEKVEGVTIMIDGMLKEFVNIVKSKDSKYQTTVDVIQDALMKGLEDIKKDFSK